MMQKTLDSRRILASIYILGSFSLIALVAGAFILAVRLLDLLITDCMEAVQHVVHDFQSIDPISQLIFLMILALCGSLIYRLVRR